jgi:hypothetical protein
MQSLLINPTLVLVLLKVPPISRMGVIKKQAPLKNAE